VTEINFWLEDWAHDCCGPLRRVGDVVTVALSLEGSVGATKDPDSIEQLSDGEMVITGHAAETKNTEPGLIVSCGGVSFGVSEGSAGTQLKCRGKLWEERHGSPDGGPAVGQTTGRVTAIFGHRATHERTGERSWRVTGYQAGVRIDGTNSFPFDRVRDDAAMKRFSEDIASGKIKGRWTIEPAPPEDDPTPPDSWAFEFVLEVSN
jgi:hypothetical protein